MYIKQSDLFLGLNHNFVKEIMAIAEKESHAEGDFIFQLGDPANHDGKVVRSKGRPDEVDQLFQVVLVAMCNLRCECCVTFSLHPDDPSRHH